MLPFAVGANYTHFIALVLRQQEEDLYLSHPAVNTVTMAKGRADTRLNSRYHQDSNFVDIFLVDSHADIAPCPLSLGDPF